LCQKSCYTKTVFIQPGKQRIIIFAQRILGIDPGIATVGYGALLHARVNQFTYLASGTIVTPKNMSAGERLAMIRKDLIQLIEQFNPNILAVEAIFFFKNAKTAMSVAQARGVILETAAACNIPVAEYTPMQVKLQITGFGKADKRLVQEMVASRLDLPQVIKPDDASDALAIAVCHAHHSHIAANLVQPLSLVSPQPSYAV
jgi:crossover junction endodeoxyribonuclease RuvC